MLLQPSDWSLAQSSDQVLGQLSDDLSARTFPETHAAVIELVTGIHLDVDGVVAELASLRDRLAHELGAMGLSVAAAGTHPLTVGAETEVSGAARYRALEDSLRVLARREPTMALHVHVGVPGPEDAIRVLNGLRRNLPVLLALSANSPFWNGRDSGFASARTLIFQAFPRAGLPPSFADYAGYVEARRRTDRARGDPRSELPVVGRAASAGARDGRGAGDGFPVSGPRRSSVGRADPVAGPSRARGRAFLGGAERSRSRREPLPGRARRDGRPADRPRSPAPDPGARDTRLPARRLPPVRARARVRRSARPGATPGRRQRGRAAARARRPQRASRPPGHDAR